MERSHRLYTPSSIHVGMNLYRNIRDSISYLRNPDRFVADRSAKLGPIFLSYQFFRPTVFLGGQKNVQQFISRTELKNSVVYPALPDTFLELHTKWGALNMDSTQVSEFSINCCMFSKEEKHITLFIYSSLSSKKCESCSATSYPAARR